MKVVQINAWCGRLNGPLARFLKEEQADIVCIQEAFAPSTTGLEVYQDQYRFVDEIIKAAKYPYNFFAPAWGFEMGNFLIDEGNIILSKYPLSDMQSFHTYNQYYIRNIKNELPNTRIWQSCTVQLPSGKKLSVANYQGYVTGKSPVGNETTMETMRKVHKGLASLPKPLLFCGDLNINPESPGITLLNNLGLVNLPQQHKIKTTLSPVHRAPDLVRASVACDYIFASKDIKVNDFKVAEALVSDHKALILEFEL